MKLCQASPLSPEETAGASGDAAAGAGEGCSRACSGTGSARAGRGAGSGGVSTAHGTSASSGGGGASSAPLPSSDALSGAGTWLCGPDVSTDWAMSGRAGFSSETGNCPASTRGTLMPPDLSAASSASTRLSRAERAAPSGDNSGEQRDIMASSAAVRGDGLSRRPAMR